MFLVCHPRLPINMRNKSGGKGVVCAGNHCSPKIFLPKRLTILLEAPTSPCVLVFAISSRYDSIRKVEWGKGEWLVVK